MAHEWRNGAPAHDEADDYSMLLQWDPRDRIYVVTVQELPGCMTHGRTAVEAVEMGHEAIEGWIAFARSRGRAIPPPRTYPAEEGIVDSEEDITVARVAVS